MRSLESKEKFMAAHPNAKSFTFADGDTFIRKRNRMIGLTSDGKSKDKDCNKKPTIQKRSAQQIAEEKRKQEEDKKRSKVRIKICESCGEVVDNGRSEPYNDFCKNYTGNGCDIRGTSCHCSWLDWIGISESSCPLDKPEWNAE